MRSMAAALAAVLGLIPLPASADEVGLVDGATGVWYLRDSGGETTSFYYGNAGDAPLMGDWDCDGIDTPGLYRSSDGFVYLRNSNTQGVAEVEYFLGNPDDIALAGDFDGDGCDTVSVYRPSEGRFYLTDRLSANGEGLGAVDGSFIFGDMGDRPFVGDFDGDGDDEIGLHRPSTGLIYLRFTPTQGVADVVFTFGNVNDRIISGDWTGDLADTLAAFRPGDATFYVSYLLGPGDADKSFRYGDASMQSVAGNFGVLPGGDPPPPSEIPSCLTGAVSSPTGSFDVVPGTTPAPAAGVVRRFRVEIEHGLPVDERCFARAVASILGDPRGWAADANLGFQQVDGDDYDYRIVLASPSTTDRMCLPLNTGGIFSCRNGNRAVLNFNRWSSGAAAYGANLTGYRNYLVNHEVGHLLGHGHLGCTGAGDPAPVMMQQTKGVGSCIAQPWPLAWER